MKVDDQWKMTPTSLVTYTHTCMHACVRAHTCTVSKKSCKEVVSTDID